MLCIHFNKASTIDEGSEKIIERLHASVSKLAESYKKAEETDDGFVITREPLLAICGYVNNRFSSGAYVLSEERASINRTYNI